MARRSTKAERNLFLALFLIAVPVIGFYQVIEAVGVVIPFCATGAGIALWIYYRHSKKKQRQAYLEEKYQDENLVQNITQGRFWKGQTEEQLKESLGEPADIDHKFLKTINREIWKYNHRGANRYGLRITVDDGYVTTWDQK